MVIVGGGYGGITLGKKLDGDFEVTIIERKDKFMHNTAIPRAIVSPPFADKACPSVIFLIFSDIYFLRQSVEEWEGDQRRSGRNFSR